MIDTQCLGKAFGAVQALRDLTLSVAKGELFGLVGPNGAGKTTALRILATLLRPTSGSAYVAGLSVVDDAAAVRECLGYVPDTPVLYEKLTGAEFLRFIADVRRIEDRSRVGMLLDLFSLDEVANDLVETYSYGMRKKLSLAAALVHKPQVLLLDEPTAGLDPAGASVVKELLVRLTAEGVAVLTSTHQLEVVERFCHRIGVLHRGTLRACGTLRELQDQFGDEPLERIFLRLTASAHQPAAEDHGNA